MLNTGKQELFQNVEFSGRREIASKYLLSVLMAVAADLFKAYKLDEMFASLESFEAYVVFDNHRVKMTLGIDTDCEDFFLAINEGQKFFHESTRSKVIYLHASNSFNINPSALVKALAIAGWVREEDW